MGGELLMSEQVYDHADEITRVEHLKLSDSEYPRTVSNQGLPYKQRRWV